MTDDASAPNVTVQAGMLVPPLELPLPPPLVLPPLPLPPLVLDEFDFGSLDPPQAATTAETSMTKPSAHEARMIAMFSISFPRKPLVTLTGDPDADRKLLVLCSETSLRWILPPAAPAIGERNQLMP
jgi:hypothetical protein